MSYVEMLIKLTIKLPMLIAFFCSCFLSFDLDAEELKIKGSFLKQFSYCSEFQGLSENGSYEMSLENLNETTGKFFVEFDYNNGEFIGELESMGGIDFSHFREDNFIYFNIVIWFNGLPHNTFPDIGGEQFGRIELTIEYTSDDFDEDKFPNIKSGLDIQFAQIRFWYFGSGCSGTFEVPDYVIDFSVTSADNLTTYTEEIRPYFPESTYLSEGWVQSSWYSDFNIIHYPWLFHRYHGFQYLALSEASSWVYDTELGWVWIVEEHYPFMYSHEKSAWIYYLNESKEPRWFYDFEQRIWYSVD